MPRVFHISLLGLGLVLGRYLAQAQSEEVPLGDLARSLRKNQSPQKAVIDNDNLSAVMEQGETKRWATGTRSSSAKRTAIAMVNISPDVTCALSFSGQKDILRESLQPQKLPDDELAKLDGPATMVGDSLQLSLRNGSDWDVREITVAITLIAHQTDLSAQLDGWRFTPVAVNEVGTSEKRSERTVLYHLKGTAAPQSTTTFQTPLNLTIAPDQEWHWAIVQAKGVAPSAPAARAPETNSTTIQAPY
jgi:hypothetical protein